MNYNIPKKSIITIAGTVGIGKSTLTKHLSKALNFQTSFEKVDDNPYLNSFYKDFKRWSFHLQIFFLAERFKEQKRMFDQGGAFIQDRSIYEDTGIFAKMLYEKGNMTKVDYDTYTSLFNSMVLTPYFPKPNLLIYLDADFDEVINRLQKRGRDIEKETPNDYWLELFNRYEQWINHFDHCPVLRLNINEYDLYNEPNKSIAYILKKIEETI